jgi:hypothetical protein
MRSLAAALSLVSALLLVGCMGDEDAAMTRTAPAATTATSPPAGTSKELRIYLLRERKVAPVARTVVTGPRVGAAAMRELLEGPSADEEDLETAIPTGTELESLAIRGGVASVELSSPLAQDAAAQVVYTLTDAVSDRQAGRRRS